MKRCILCGRKISNTKYNFGLGCLKKMCNSIRVYNVKNLKGENLLDRKILKLCNKKTLPKVQRQLLTDRYLTLNLLNQVPLECYNNYKILLKNDIDNINHTTTIMDLRSYDIITLKQASEINKTYKKNEDVFQKIMNGEYDDIQNISFNVINLAFSLYYNRKPYLSSELQLLQHYILKCAAQALRVAGLEYSSQFLEHSLQENPSDITITEGNIISLIKENNFFNDKLNEIIKKYNNKSHFDTGEKNESLSFEYGDLFYSLHSMYIHIVGDKQSNDKWNLDITLSDVYDFTDFKEISEYLGDDKIKDFIGSTGNNIAMLATSCNVVNQYNVIIKFEIEELEVK